MPVGLRNLKNCVSGLPIRMFGCLLSLFADHASIKLFPAATINISLLRSIPDVRGGTWCGVVRVKRKLCKVSEIIYGIANSFPYRTGTNPAAFQL